MNRTSQPLNLGCPAVWDTPGKLCFFTSPSYWGQFWVVCPPLWYESNLSNTPKTLRKVIPVKDFSGEHTEYWIKLGKLWKYIGQKRLDGPSCSRSWKFTSDLFHLDLNPSFNILFRACWMSLWKITQIANVGITWDVLQWIFQLHEAFSTTTLLQMKT